MPAYFSGTAPRIYPTDEVGAVYVRGVLTQNSECEITCELDLSGQADTIYNIFLQKIPGYGPA